MQHFELSVKENRNVKYQKILYAVHIKLTISAFLNFKLCRRGDMYTTLLNLLAMILQSATFWLPTLKSGLISFLFLPLISLIKDQVFFMFPLQPLNFLE